mmetsp:Transcript_22191/g.68875  ORF Transcript_22191/g.68875 Transcript_22191/m.68875 type:complete len:219 (-) Transcript_22191:397-1053(-)
MVQDLPNAGTQALAAALGKKETNHARGRGYLSKFHGANQCGHRASTSHSDGFAFSSPKYPLAPRTRTLLLQRAVDAVKIGRRSLGRVLLTQIEHDLDALGGVGAHRGLALRRRGHVRQRAPQRHKRVSELLVQVLVHGGGVLLSGGLLVDGTRDGRVGGCVHRGLAQHRHGGARPLALFLRRLLDRHLRPDGDGALHVELGLLRLPGDAEVVVGHLET